jgi:virginiamycin B lyase
MQLFSTMVNIPEAQRDVLAESGLRPNTLVRFDPRTEQFQSWIIPGGGGGVRNMTTTRDGNLAIAESVNKVGVVELGR